MKRWVKKVELENVELTCGVGALVELWFGEEVGGKSRVRKCRVDLVCRCLRVSYGRGKRWVEKVELENVELTCGVGALGDLWLGEEVGGKSRVT